MTSLASPLSPLSGVIMWSGVMELAHWALNTDTVWHDSKFSARLGRTAQPAPLPPLLTSPHCLHCLHCLQVQRCPWLLAQHNTSLHFLFSIQIIKRDTDNATFIHLHCLQSVTVYPGYTHTIHRIYTIQDTGNWTGHLTSQLLAWKGMLSERLSDEWYKYYIKIYRV